MDVVYYIVSVIAIILVVALTLGVIKPSWAGWAYKLIKKSPQDLSRKFIVATAVPALLVSGSVLGATEPASLKAERAAREHAAMIAKEKAEKDALEKTKAETARLAKEKQAAEAARKKAEAEKQAAEEKKKAAEAEKQKLEAEAKAAEAAKNAASAAAATPPAPQPRAYSPAPTTRSTPAPPAPSTNTVHAGAYCSPAGATGVFSSGNPAVCAIDSKGVRLRWQSP